MNEYRDFSKDWQPFGGYLEIANKILSRIYLMEVCIKIKKMILGSSHKYSTNSQLLLLLASPIMCILIPVEGFIYLIFGWNPWPHSRQSISLDLRLFTIHIITNGKDREKTSASSSLQQGDSLSAFVFILVVDCKGPNSLSMNFLQQGDTSSPFGFILLVYSLSRLLAISASRFLWVGTFYILTQRNISWGKMDISWCHFEELRRFWHKLVTSCFIFKL